VPLRRRPIDWLLGVVEAGAFLTAVFSVVTVFDRLHQYLELFSHFRLQYFAAALVALVALALARRQRMAVVMLAVALLNAFYILPWYGNVARAGSPATLTLLHSNILAGNPDVGRLLAHIEREAPDLVFIQELTPHHVRLLESLSTRFPYRLLAPRDDAWGIGAWSMRPFVAADVLETPPRGLPSLRLEVDQDGTPLTIFSTHPATPIGDNGFADRNRQLAAIADAVNQGNGPTIVAGDLNTTPWGAHYRAFEAATGLRNAQAGHGIKPSWPLFLPIAMIPIDHVLLSSDLAAVEVRTLSSIGSDHLPLLVRIAPLL
jgi:endonuclease/exonuclease/phosphatase (EEP) superfamily protein YafD